MHAPPSRTAAPTPSIRDVSSDVRRRVLRQGLSIALAVVPFGIAFGVATVDAGLSVWHALGFSALVFTGSAQFAAVGVLADGGSAVAAVAAGALLNLRSLAFGVTMAPALRGPAWWRVLASQLMIDEAMAVGSGQTTPSAQRLGYVAGGGGVFISWNVSTVVGAALFSGAGDVVTTFGIDATIPAAFLALLWPRLADPGQRRVALAGAGIAALLLPLAPAGIPILAAGLGVFVVWRTHGPVTS